MSSAARVPTAFSSAHRAYVQSLYRRYLRNSLDWNIRRDAWRAEALSIRAAFEKNRNIRNPRELARVLQEAEEQLQKIAHPDPYRRKFLINGKPMQRQRNEANPDCITQRLCSKAEPSGAKDPSLIGSASAALTI